MTIHSSTSTAIAIALVVSIGGASVAAGQDTTRTRTDTTVSKRTTRPRHAASSTRIPVSKNERVGSAGGEVTPPPKPDTTTITPPPDTTMKVDTTTRVTIVDTTARVDTTTRVVTPPETTTVVSAAPPIVMRTRVGVFYVGVAGGASIPTGDIYNGYNPGFNVTVPMGWDSYTMPIGVRFDVAYDRLMARSTFRNNGLTTAAVTTNGGYSVGTTTTPVASSGSGTTSGGYNGTARVASSDVQLWSAMLDGKLRLPFASGSRASLYAVGGGGVHYFTNYANSLALTNPAAEQALRASNTSTTGAYSSSSSGYSAVTRFGLNGGAGLQWGVGNSNLFVEGRYVTVLTKDRHTDYWPVVLGITIR